MCTIMSAPSRWHTSLVSSMLVSVAGMCICNRLSLRSFAQHVALIDKCSAGVEDFGPSSILFAR